MSPSNTGAAALDARALRFAAGDLPILNGVDLVLAPGERLAIIGPNGSGKSTLLRCLYAWHQPDAGVVMLDGSDVFKMPASERARAVAVLAQHAGAGLGLTVAEVVALGRLPHGRSWRGGVGDAAAVTEALVTVGLLDWRERSFAPLSGGEKQRVLFARALAQRPRLLILDEPTNHLDIRHQLDLLRVARDLGVSVIATLHDLNVAARWGDRLCLLDAGIVRRVGPPDVVLDPDLIGPVYGVSVARDRDPRTRHPRLSFYLDEPSQETAP